MLQTYVIRTDVDPLAASRLGLDSSNCGTCPMRGEANPKKASGQADARACYVQLGQGPRGVYESLVAGKYPRARRSEIPALVRGRQVRIGTYGDGAAVPAWVWHCLLRDAAGHVGYSHQSGNPCSSFDPRLQMVSADSERDAWRAWGKGYRTFRVMHAVSDLVKHKEVLCPASEEAGRRTTCAHCRLCGGTSVSAKSIAIVAHGAGKGNL